MLPVCEDSGKPPRAEPLHSVAEAGEKGWETLLTSCHTLILPAEQMYVEEIVVGGSNWCHDQVAATAAYRFSQPESKRMINEGDEYIFHPRKLGEM